MITKADIETLMQAAQILAKICTEMQEQVKLLAEQRKPAKMQANTLTMAQACKVYGVCDKTMRKYLEFGICKGEKRGGEWRIETPESRYNRLTI